QAGDIDFSESVTLGNAATASMVSNGGNVNFLGTVDGASALSTNTTGMTTFAANIGSTTRPISIHITGPTTFGIPTANAPVASRAMKAAALSPLGAGVIPTPLKGDVQGFQSYDGPVLLTDATTLSSSGGGDIVFGSNVEAQNGVGLTASVVMISDTEGQPPTAVGVVKFRGPVGDSEPLGSLEVD